MRPIIMNFSGIYREEDFWEDQEPVWLDFQRLQGVNCYCTPEAEAAIKEKICDLPVQGIHFLDSGNYHYLSKFWLEMTPWDGNGKVFLRLFFWTQAAELIQANSQRK